MNRFIRKLKNSFYGRLVGQDHFGNNYYIAKKPDYNGKNRRWVDFNGLEEASKVPPEWHGWLHYTFDAPLEKSYAWQEEYIPNLTGTTGACFPPGHTTGKGQRDRVSSDYQPWNPDQS
jgi:NADH:ubiquinone oxidoreductase subunit